MHFVNLTPHQIDIWCATTIGRAVFQIPSTGVVRVAERRVPLEPIPSVGGIVMTTAVAYGEITGLPDPQDGVVYIVSGIVRGALGASRPDVYSPGPLVRDAGGKPIGCDGLTGVAWR